MTRIINTEFFADSINGFRTPQQTNTIVDEVGEPVVPDPELPGGGDPDTDPGEGDGGNIGTPGGSGTVTTGNAPTITRRINGVVYSSPQDVAVQSGTVSITYIADADCTMLPKMSYEDDTVSYSQNGREMTISWVIPGDEPGDSWWFGCEAWVYGGDSVEAYTLTYDRVHVAKSSSDITTALSSQAVQDAMETMSFSGQTMVIPDGIKTTSRDTCQIGWDNFNNTYNTQTPNGAHTNRTLYQDPTNPGNATGTTADVTKYTVIMTETPLGVLLNRQGQGGGIGINGNRETFPNSSNNQTSGGFRESTGIKIKGFGLINSNALAFYSTPIRTQRSTTCFIDACYFLEDLVYGEVSGWSGDGGCTAHTNSENCGFNYGGGPGNSRLLNSQVGQTDNCVHSRFLTTCGATQLVNQQRTQTFSSYSARNGWYRNCIALDGALYNPGTINYNGQNPIPNYVFNSTNAVNNNMSHEACVSFNDVRGFIQINASGLRYGETDKITDCVGFHKVRNNTHPGNGWEMLRGGPFDVTRCTFGRNQDLSTAGASIETDGQNNPGSLSTINGMFVNQPSWDYNPPSDAVFSSGSYRYSSLQNIGIAGSPYTPNTNTTGATSNYVRYSTAITQTSGFKYWMRAEEGSTIDQNNFCARDVFCARGRYGIDATSTRSGFDTVYNGRNGNNYVNWISRSPWIELRNLWRQYNCASNGVSLSGNVGWAAEGVNPIDYLLRQGTTPGQPINTPYIEDLYVYEDSNGDSVLAWRPICPAYRSTITGYDIYVDNQPVAFNVAKQTTQFTITGLASGTRAFNIVVKDSTYGDSGKSRTVTRVVS